MSLCPSAAVVLLAALVTLAVVPTFAGGRASSGTANGAASGPAFSPRQRTAVLAHLGDSVELVCWVQRLADRTVSWVRSNDLQILTHAGAVFTADARVSCSEGAPVLDQYDAPVTRHVLRIARLRPGDAGRYECQVNTEPKMSLFFNLTVVEYALPKVVVWVEGDGGRGIVRGEQGGAARLACGARYEPASAASDAMPPLRITWKHAGLDVDPESGRGGVSLDAERWAGGATSRLTLGALEPEDAGQYTCSARGVSATITLRIAGADDYGDLVEDVAGEMQRDQAAARASASSGHPARAPPRTASLLLASYLSVVLYALLASCAP